MKDERGERRVERGEWRVESFDIKLYNIIKNRLLTFELVAYFR